MQFSYFAIFAVLATIAMAAPSPCQKRVATEPAATHTRDKGLGLGLDLSVHL
ncbi:hypothetical protein GGI15_004871 [Coemansia interrupta]|uniref:Uncharacterized protein n=1 Tax=Coemansia interrupta TaxID=1126814 RepID=A0A9W8H8A2_9FUNG|nr:hypothetical protein GGI15_004871 [Coemansia interrupta]